MGTGIQMSIPWRSHTVNACSVAASNDEDDDNDSIALDLGFTGQSMKVALDCNEDTCSDEWDDTGDSDGDADTYSVALSSDGKYFYSVDSKTSKIAIGTKKSDISICTLQESLCMFTMKRLKQSWELWFIRL